MVKRNVNIDLFRVIATLLVVLLHVLGQGGILRNTSPGSIAYNVAWFLEICAYCAVNCFALISGYVMVNKNVKLKSIINTWLQVLFYSLLFTALFFILLPESRSIKNLVVSVLPVLGKQWWYISSYFVLFFFIPFLNKAIDNISQQDYKKFLLVVLIGIGLLNRIIPIDSFTLNKGYSGIWLIIVYLFGAYIKKYDLSKKITALKSALGFLAIAVITFISKLGIRFVTKLIFGQIKFENAFISYCSITILFSAIFLFLFCLNIKISPAISKLICFLSPATLGVYLIHVHPLVFKYIIKDAFASFADKPVIIMLLYIAAATLLIFAACSTIELIRIRLFKLIKISKLCEITESKINAFYFRFFEK